MTNSEVILYLQQHDGYMPNGTKEHYAKGAALNETAIRKLRANEILDWSEVVKTRLFEAIGETDRRALLRKLMLLQELFGLWESCLRRDLSIYGDDESARRDEAMINALKAIGEKLDHDEQG